MHKYILTYILIVFSLPSYSQQFEGGFFGGFSASQVDGDTYSGYNKIGITAGAYTTRKINRNLNWKAEIRYIQKGAFKKNTEFDPTMFKTSLQFIEFPLLLQYLYNKKVFFEAGLAPEILIASKEESDGYIIPVEHDRLFHRFVIEATAGAGYFLTDHLVAGFRYTYSVLPIRDHAYGTTFRLNRGQDNNVLSFTMYYHFR
jgi:hypothetical protein